MYEPHIGINVNCLHECKRLVPFNRLFDMLVSSNIDAILAERYDKQGCAK